MDKKSTKMGNTYLITSGIFNVPIEFCMTPISKTILGYYEESSKTVVILVGNAINRAVREGVDFRYMAPLLEGTLIHELAHFFDYNCWLSWQYKAENPHEQLATFVELYHQAIQGVLKQARPIIKRIVKENNVSPKK